MDCLDHTARIKGGDCGRRFQEVSRGAISSLSHPLPPWLVSSNPGNALPADFPSSWEFHGMGHAGDAQFTQQLLHLLTSHLMEFPPRTLSLLHSLNQFQTRMGIYANSCQRSISGAPSVTQTGFSSEIEKLRLLKFVISSPQQTGKGFLSGKRGAAVLWKPGYSSNWAPKMTSFEKVSHAILERAK